LLWLAWLLLETAGMAQRAPAPRQGLLADPLLEPLEPPPPGVAMSDESFESWFFGRVGGADQARHRLESRLAWEIQRVDRLYGLDPAQKHKLELAGRGDIKRFFDDVRKKEAMLDRARGDLPRHHALMTELEPLRTHAPQILFIDGSLFVKTLRNTLSPDQRARYEQDRFDFYRHRVAWAASYLEQRLRLSREQRDRFVDLIVAESRPLRRYGPGDFSAILFQASRLPEGKLRPIFHDDQWLLLLGQFQGIQQMERILVAEGYLPESQPARM
jgi:hypothetical protein